MKTQCMLVLSLILAGAVAILSGCGGEQEPTVSPVEGTPVHLAPPSDLPIVEKESRPTLEDVQQQTAEAARTLWDFAKNKSEEFRDAMAREMNGIDARMAQLRERASELSGAAREKMDEQLVQLEEKRKELAEQLERASANSGEAWDETKAGIRKAYEEVSDALGRAYAELQSPAEEDAPVTPQAEPDTAANQ